MATETLRPTGIGSETAIPNCLNEGADTEHWQAVDEEVANDNTDYVYTNEDDTYTRDLYAVENHSVGSGVISKVTIHLRLKLKDAQNMLGPRASLRTHDTTYNSTDIALIKNTWGNFSKEWATNPNTGNPWTWDEIDALEIGVRLRGVSGMWGWTSYCTQVYVVVEYSLAEELSESITPTDSISKVGTFVRTLDDSITANDSISKTTDLSDFTESVTLTGTHSLSPTKGLSDLITPTDSISKIGTFTRTLDENISVVLARNVLVQLNPAFSITMADNVTKTLTQKSHDETITSSDNFSLSSSKTLSGSFTLTDSISQVISVEYSESITPSDSMAFLLDKEHTASFSLSDSISKTGTFVRTLTDAVTTVIDKDILVQLNPAFTITMTDNVTKFLTQQPYTETVTPSDTYSRSPIKVLSESFNPADSVALLSVFLRTFSESITPTESISKTGTFVRTLTDAITTIIDRDVLVQLNPAFTITMTDSVVKSLTQGSYDESITMSDVQSLTPTKSLTESFTLGDSRSMVADMVRSFNESITLSESRVNGMMTTFSESLTPTDTVDPLSVLTRTCTDTLTLSDTLAAFEIYKVIGDSITPTDSISKTGTFVRTLTDSIVAILDRDILVQLNPAFTITMVDGITKALTQKSYDEAITMSEVSSLMAGKSLLESVSPSDAVAFSMATEFTESISPSDILTTLPIKTFTESITPSDSLSKVGTFVRTLTDAVTTIVDRTILVQLNPAFTITMTDEVTKTLTRQYTESITMVDGYTFLSGKTLSESMSLTSLMSSFIAITKTEILSPLDEVYIQFIGEETNSISMSDSVSKLFVRTLTDNFTLTSSMSVTIALTMEETITPLDEVYIEFSGEEANSISIVDGITKALIKTALTDSFTLTGADTIAIHTTETNSITMQDSIVYNLKTEFLGIGKPKIFVIKTDMEHLRSADGGV